ncbi:hypothetical protein PLESTB_000071600 [Pleodorina starrii]|uniref:tRNA (guanine(9)-N(1))-methyltransferase n=1 Tax=Pleodorina starrii TaxID=330485 RepID=A0A9W6BAY3_9CHLO|nr:hypothetical protein PLESTM_000067200 [Pleodorina starrii]GLC48216.1 hypothetical protein PLESTB_000071600 [Pleodorina starrii]GLC66506.1 hypothetical protein PLESTF_000437900 [Pleodorina starrii]
MTMTRCGGQLQRRLPLDGLCAQFPVSSPSRRRSCGIGSAAAASSRHRRSCCCPSLDTLPNTSAQQSQRPLPPKPHEPSCRRRQRCAAISPAAPGDSAAAAAAPDEGSEGLDEIGVALREAARRRELLAAALAGGSSGQVMRLVIDCGFTHAIRSPAEFRSLAKQIQTSVGHNRRSEAPLCLQVTCWGGELATYAEERMGAAAWPLVKHSQSTLDLYDPEQLVVLSPDALEPLTALDERRVYVVGGIVDRSVIRGVTASFASSHCLEVRRLPTLEYSEQLGLGHGVSRRPVLNICDVVLALLRFRTNGGDWLDALDAAIPRRKRAAAAQEGSQRSRPSRRPSTQPADVVVDAGVGAAMAALHLAETRS